VEGVLHHTLDQHQLNILLLPVAEQVVGTKAVVVLVAVF